MSATSTVTSGKPTIQAGDATVPVKKGGSFLSRLCCCCGSRPEEDAVEQVARNALETISHDSQDRSRRQGHARTDSGAPLLAGSPVVTHGSVDDRSAAQDPIDGAASAVRYQVMATPSREEREAQTDLDAGATGLATSQAAATAAGWVAATVVGVTPATPVVLHASVGTPPGSEGQRSFSGSPDAGRPIGTGAVNVSDTLSPYSVGSAGTHSSSDTHTGMTPLRGGDRLQPVSSQRLFTDAQ